MSERVGVVWDERLVAYDFGPQHPLQPVRVLLAYELARTAGVFDAANVTMHPARVASRDELMLVHDGAYVDAVERISATCSSPYGNYGWGIGIGDNPAFHGMHEASAMVAGASLEAARLIAEGSADHVFSPAGGLHHAMADRASGFCIYDDPAIAIAWLLRNGHERIVYVDVDVHHGDGVQAAFYDDPRVMTISLHESGEYLFPGTGFAGEVGAAGTSVNVALPPLTHDDAYAHAFDAIVPPLVAAFRPSVLVTQLGCDTHATDPLAHFALTTRTYERLARSFHAMAHETCDGRWLAVGGGGYQIYTVVPRAWAMYASEIVGVPLPDRLPDEWIEIARSRGAPAPPEVLHDGRIEMPERKVEEAAAGARAAVEATRAAVFAFHGLA